MDFSPLIVHLPYHAFVAGFKSTRLLGHAGPEPGVSKGGDQQLSRTESVAAATGLIWIENRHGAQNCPINGGNQEDQRSGHQAAAGNLPVSISPSVLFRLKLPWISVPSFFRWPSLWWSPIAQFPLVSRDSTSFWSSYRVFIWSQSMHFQLIPSR